MASLIVVLLPFLPALLFEVSSVLGHDMRETDAVCEENGCFMVYFQRKTFLDAWKACKDKGGNLATIKHDKDAATVDNLFSNLDLRYSRNKVRVWIGLQRQPRQCSTTHLLRGFTWTTGDQDTEYTNWQIEDSQSKCSMPRCVAVDYSTQEWNDNLKWLDGPCSEPVDGYLCHYGYKDMCPALWSKGAGSALYITPFNLQSTLLTHVPVGSVATVSCPAGDKEIGSVLCMLKEDGSVGWSRDFPLCSSLDVPNNRCNQNNGGCEHLCQTSSAHFYCECDKGFQLRDDGQSCEFLDVCKEAPCEYECLPLSDGYHCACPEGYMLGPDDIGCVDVNECLQSPCEQRCVNALGTFQCQCLDGYHTDKEGLCQDVDECINYPCEHHCKNTPGSYLCHCRKGFSLVPEDHNQCQDIDECQNPRTCQQMCLNYDGGFECHCREGYTLMSDLHSCHKRNAEDDQSAPTQFFPWITRQPGPLWGPVYYDWSPKQSHTELSLKEDDSPRVVNSEETGVTSTLQNPPTQRASRDEEDINIGGTDWQILESKHEGSHSIVSTTSSSTTPYLYVNDKEDTTTASPFISTVTISGGAWNGWSELTSPLSPLSDAGQDSDIKDSVQDDKEKKQTSTWVLVGLLVPIFIIIVVMVVLGIVYYKCCSVQLNKSSNDCYHWINGAHDKQGHSSPSARAKVHV